MKTEVVREVALAPANQGTDALIQMFERLAVNPDVDVAKLEKLLDMQERIVAKHAKAAFDADFSALMATLPVIIERSKTNTGTYAALEDIVETVRPFLTARNFALSHRTEWPRADFVKIVGILSHAQGHERTSEFEAKADNSGSKNAIQALGSTMSYGRRYTTNDLLCIVTRFQDDDGGRARTEPVVDPPGYDDWMTDMEAASDEGLAVLQDAWKKVTPQYREHTDRHYRAKWEALKRKAAKVAR